MYEYQKKHKNKEMYTNTHKMSRIEVGICSTEVELTFGLVFLGAAAWLLRLGVYEIVIGMGTDVLSHSQIIAVDLVRPVRAIAERDRRQKDEQPVKKSHRMEHNVSFYALPRPDIHQIYTQSRQADATVRIFSVCFQTLYSIFPEHHFRNVPRR